MDHLGLDLGTTTISAAVLDADGRLLCTRTVPGGAAVAGQPWEHKQDARGIEHAALSLLDGLLQEFPDIGCVGLTGQMHGIVYVDAAGQLLSPLYTWQDETGAQPGANGKSMAARLTARTGYPLASGYGLVTLACHQAADIHHTSHGRLQNSYDIRHTTLLLLLLLIQNMEQTLLGLS